MGSKKCVHNVHCTKLLLTTLQFKPKLSDVGNMCLTDHVYDRLEQIIFYIIDNSF